jgi:hypothetical protein
MCNRLCNVVLSPALLAGFVISLVFFYVVVYHNNYGFL